MFRNKSSFYVKTLVFYAAAFALFYCTNMQHEQKYNDSEQLDAVERSLTPDVEMRGEPSGYPYARMMNLIAQARSIERDFHSYTVDFDCRDDDRVAKVIALQKKINKVTEKLKQEQGSFIEFVSIKPDSDVMDPTEYLCNKGKCRYSTTRHSALSRKARNQKSARYTCQVLNEYMERMEIMAVNLGRLVEQARLNDEAAKLRSENEAKLKSRELINK